MSEVSQELQEVRTLAREFAEAELRPHVEGWDHERTIPDEVLAHVAELGFFGMALPEDAGGMGFDVPTWSTALEELAWGEPAIAVLLVHHALVARLLARHAAPELRTRWLESLASGAASACTAFAEAETGVLDTTAERSGEEWHIRGTKRWVSGARAGGAMLVLARAKAGPSLFVLPVDETTRGERDATLGLRSLDVRSIHLDVRVPDAALIGAAGDAGALLEEGVGFECVGIAAISTGIAEAALRHAAGYAAEREQFGRKLRDFEGLQLKLGNMATEVAAARALLEHAARTVGVDDGAETAPGGHATARMAKVFAATTAMHVTTEAVQIYGGYGYMRDYPVEKLMRDARAMALIGGADERHTTAIAASLYQD